MSRTPILILSLLAGCQDANPNVGSSGVDPKFGASLEVKSATQRSQLGPQTAPTFDTLFVVVDLVLTNRGSIPLPLESALFSVETPEGLAYQADSRTGVAGLCDGASLVGGHSVGCQVVFDLPRPARTAAVLYTLPDLSTLRAPVTTPPCEMCGGPFCVDLYNDVDNCGACGVRAQICEGGIPACAGPAYSLCAGGCVTPLYDDDNCGACGNRCAAGTRCDDGTCRPITCQEKSFDECLTCCEQTNPVGSDFYITTYQACVCTQQECGDFVCTLGDFCDTGEVTTELCADCMQRSACDPAPACTANTACAAYLDCIGTC